MSLCASSFTWSPRDGTSLDTQKQGHWVAAHQQILIDGQQRITALRAAVAGLKVVNKRYKSVRITIAFNPVTEEFATLTPVQGVA